MAENLGDAVLRLRTDNSQLDAGINQARGEAEGLAGHFEQLGQRMVGVGAKLSIAVTAPLILFGKQAISAASDAAELQSAFNVTFGSMSGAMSHWAEETGNAMGRSTQEMQKGAQMFGLFFNQSAPTKAAAADMSRSFTVLAQDLSSFYNVDPGVALEKLRSGLAGETEPLRDFGIFLTEATVQQKALAMGLAPTTAALTEQDKVMARAALIMEATKNAQGDVARTSGGTANQVRAATAAWDELKVTIGTKLLPVITPLITNVGELLNWFSQLPGPVMTGVVAFLGLATALGPVLMGIGGLMSAFAPLAASIAGAVATAGGLGAALGGLAAVALPVVAVVAALVGAWMLFGDKIMPVLQALWDKVSAVLGPKLTALFTTIKTALTELWNGPFGSAIKAVIGFLGDFGAAYTSVMGEALIRVISAAVDIISGAFKNIVSIIKLVVAVLTGDWAGAWNAAKALVSNAINMVLNVLDDLVPGARKTITNLTASFATGLGNLATKMIGFGRDIIDGLVRGIMAAPQAVWNALKSVVLSGINNIRDFLGIRSPSLLFMEMGGHITDGLAIGILNGIGAVSDAMGALGRAVADGMPTPDTGTVVTAPVGTPGEDQASSWRDGFKTWFHDGITAAMNGDLGGFLSNWIKGIGKRALDGLINSLGDVLTNALSGLFNGGSKSGGGLSGALSAVSQGGGSGGGLGGLIASLGSAFKGLFAGGGMIPHGSFGIAGERGPETIISTPRGTVVRPNRALSQSLGSRGPSVHMPITIDATGADAAALERVRREISRLRSELPGTIIATVQDAGDRRLIRAGSW